VFFDFFQKVVKSGFNGSQNNKAPAFTVAEAFYAR
jgi:hypothetical protein